MENLKRSIHEIEKRLYGADIKSFGELYDELRKEMGIELRTNEAHRLYWWLFYLYKKVNNLD